MSDRPIVVPLSLRDSDFDGVSDYDELYVLGTNPYAVDTDRDGIPDGCDLNPRVSQSVVSDVAQQLGSGQGQHYSIVLNGPLLQISALDGRSGLNGHGMIFYQYGNETLSELCQDDLNRFAQFHHQLSISQSTPQLDRD